MPIPSADSGFDRTSAAQQIYNTLKEWIVDGTLMPGEFISDSEIAKSFSVSRTPVREAILLLSQQDFVKIMPSKGTKVTETSEETASYVYEAISCFSAEIARLAARKHTTEDIAQLKKLNRDFAFAVKQENHSRTMETDSAFHEYLLKMADNPYIAQSWNQLLPHATRYELLYFRDGVDKEISINEHKAIIKAIENNQEGEAARYSQQNWSGFFEERLKPQLQKYEK